MYKNYVCKLLNINNLNEIAKKKKIEKEKPQNGGRKLK